MASLIIITDNHFSTHKKIPMERILHRHLQTILLSLFLLLLNNFPSTTSQQNDQYYINCGSTSNITVGRRTFVGDTNTFSSRQTSSISTNTTTSLYNTARIFRQKSWYEFNILQNGTYIVRLHFFAFNTTTSQDNLLNAKFNVSASGFPFLSNFTVKNSSNSPLIEEFLLTINKGKFKIDFLPDSVAFINAIEVILTPEPLISSDSAPRINSFGVGNNGSYNGLLSNALHVIYRINVGGDIITPDNDNLPRNWVPDDDYLLIPDSAMNWSQTARPNYKEGFANEYDAPDSVYKTAKVMNISYGSSFFNISWRFALSKNDKFLVRAHFSDVVSIHLSTMIKFNLYIYGNYSQEIDPRGGSSRPMVAVPFYMDFVVDSDDSGFLIVSVGPRQDSENKTAFLNGLEIMKLISDKNLIPNGNGGGKKELFIIVGSVIGGTVLIIISLGILLFLLKRKKGKSVETSEGPLSHFLGGSSHSRTTQKNDYGSPMQALNLRLKVPLAAILFATKNFDENFFIGEGGFGKVYKGTLRNGTKVAVKRSEPGRGQGFSEFQTEIMILSKIRQRNLVSLIGYCAERSEMILVYEFMEKGTLREHLYNSKGESRKPALKSGLSWEKRLQLCMDAAKGLHYLHAGLDRAIIHRDIKSTNILIDEHFVAKVADFGISRSGHLDESHIITDVKGSFGYLDPECFRTYQLTQKSDVYAFGVVLLEVLCARAAIDNSLPGDEINLADWGMLCIREGEFEKLIDPLLVGKINPNSLKKFVETVEKCLQELGVDRPDMVDVLWDLEYALKLQRTALPRQPHEDSTTDVSCDLPLPVIHRLPSYSFPTSEEDQEMPLNAYSDTNCSSASEVFSQLRMDEAR